MKKNYLSIDIGGTNVKYAELNNAGNIIEQGKIKTSHDKEQFLKNIDPVSYTHLTLPTNREV